MHQHSTKENVSKELTEAFKGMDPAGKGYIKSKDLWHILVKWGEKLSPREGKWLVGWEEDWLLMGGLETTNQSPFIIT